MKPGRSAATSLGHLRALALVQRHVFDRFRQVHDGGERDDDRHDAADLKQDLPAILGHEEGADHSRRARRRSARTPTATIASVARRLRGADFVH